MIKNLGWYYSTFVIFKKIARPGNGTFLYFDAKIYQHIPYGSADTDAKEKPNKWDN